MLRGEITSSWGTSWDKGPGIVAVGTKHLLEHPVVPRYPVPLSWRWREKLGWQSKRLEKGPGRMGLGASEHRSPGCAVGWQRGRSLCTASQAWQAPEEKDAKLGRCPLSCLSAAAGFPDGRGNRIREGSPMGTIAQCGWGRSPLSPSQGPARAAPRPQ